MRHTKTYTYTVTRGENDDVAFDVDVDAYIEPADPECGMPESVEITDVTGPDGKHFTLTDWERDDLETKILGDEL